MDSQAERDAFRGRLADRQLRETVKRRRAEEVQDGSLERAAEFVYEDPQGSKLLVNALNSAFCTLTVVDDDGTVVNVLIDSRVAHRISVAVSVAGDT
jgi:hypothetical protein